MKNYDLTLTFEQVELLRELLYGYDLNLEDTQNTTMSINVKREVIKERKFTRDLIELVDGLCE